MATIKQGIYWLFLLIDSIIYNFFVQVYKLFLLLAKQNVFKEEIYANLIGNIYVILGVVMLFVLSYSVLKLVIDPEKDTGDYNPSKIVMTVVTSIALLMLLPSIFDIAMRVQTSVLESNTLEKIILNTPTKKTGDEPIEKSLESTGYSMANQVFKTFFQPVVENCDKEDLAECATVTNSNGVQLAEVYNDVETGNSSFYAYTSFAKQIVDEDISYYVIISSAAGVFLLYIMASYCFDLAVRAVKLIFLQAIAPIPVMARILPGSAKEIFSNWVKKTIATYFEVFVRIIFMLMAVFLISAMTQMVADIWASRGAIDGFFMRYLVTAFLIMGVLTFLKQAPQFLSEIFPQLDSSAMKLGIGEKLGVGGGLALGAGVGGAVTSFARNWNADKSANKAKRLASGLGGAVSGLGRGGTKGWGSKSFSEMAASASAATREAEAKREKRKHYKATHGGTWGGYAKGKFADKIGGVKDWAGGVPDPSALESKIPSYNMIIDARDEFGGVLADRDDLLETYNAEISNLEKTEISLPEISKYHSVFDEAAYNNARANAINAGRDFSSISKDDFTSRTLKTDEEYENEMRTAMERATAEKSRQVDMLKNLRNERQGMLLNAAISNDIATLQKAGFSEEKAKEASKAINTTYKQIVSQQEKIIRENPELYAGNVQVLDRNSADFSKAVNDQRKLVKDSLLPELRAEIDDSRNRAREAAERKEK